MRSKMEIFRGKNESGEWVHGCLSVIAQKTKGLDIEPGCYISNSVGCPFAYRVMPETVGQRTGIVDINGNGIFEGDLLRDTKRMNIYKVVWWGCRAGFEIEETPSATDDAYKKSHPGTMYFTNQSLGRFEIIGNIHEVRND